MSELSGLMKRKTLVTALGALGIVPFALSLLLPDPEMSLRVFSLYSLAILSFLAGSWWATALVSIGPNEAQRLPIVLFSNVLVLIALVLVLWSGSLTQRLNDIKAGEPQKHQRARPKHKTKRYQHQYVTKQRDRQTLRFVWPD